MAFKLSSDGLALTRWPHNGWKVRPCSHGWDFDNNHSEIIIRVIKGTSRFASWGVMVVDDATERVFTKSGLVIGMDAGRVVHVALIELLIEAMWSDGRVKEWT